MPLPSFILPKGLSAGKLKNISARTIFFISVLFINFMLLWIIIWLAIKSAPVWTEKSIAGLLLSQVWLPAKGGFGMLSFIIGTVLATLIAVVLAAPPAILSAIYLHEYASKKIMTVGRTLIDLLAGIPSVVFGLWGIITIVPLVRNHIAPAFGINTTGYCLLSCGLVLSIMIVPFIMLMVIEVLDGIPNELRESSLALGATKWQTVKHVVMRRAYPGILSAVALGVSRALGETMAVLMVAGNVPAVPSSIFEPVYPLPALIANNYGEMLSIPLYDSALMFSALVLLAMVLVFNIGLHIFKKTARYGGRVS